jgi:predicted metal-dependent hydrolase
LNAPALLDYLRHRDVRLRVVDDRLLVDAPASVADEELRHTLSKHKAALLKHLRHEQQELEEANERGLIIQWNNEPGWISLHDPTSGEWHDVRPSECLPGIVESAIAQEKRLRDAANREFHDGQV